MQIPGKSPLQLLPAAPPAGTESRTGGSEAATAAPATAGGADRVDLSGHRRLTPSEAQGVETATEVRRDRIMQIRHQLAEGTYRVEGSRIAVSMVDEAMENNRILKLIDTQA